MQLSHQTPRVHQMFQNVEAQNRIERALHRDQARYKGFIFHVADVRKIDTTSAPQSTTSTTPTRSAWPSSLRRMAVAPTPPPTSRRVPPVGGTCGITSSRTKSWYSARTAGGIVRIRSGPCTSAGRARDACHPFDNMCHRHAPGLSTQSDRHVDSSVITSMASGERLGLGIRRTAERTSGRIKGSSRRTHERQSSSICAVTADDGAQGLPQDHQIQRGGDQFSTHPASRGARTWPSSGCCAR